MKTVSQRPQLPKAIRVTLESVRQLLRRYVIAKAAMLSIVWGIAVFWLGALIDYAPVRMGASETARWVRVLILLTMASGVIWILGSRLFALLFRRIPDRSLALLIEREYPHFQNELVTTVELAGRDDIDVSDPTVHATMLHQVESVAIEKLKLVDPSGLFNWKPLRVYTASALISSLLTLVFIFVAFGWFAHWSKRLFGLRDTPWPRQALLRADGIELLLPSFSGQLTAQRLSLPFDDKLLRVTNGASATLQVSAEAEKHKVPEICTLFYNSDDGTTGRANMRRVGSPVAGWQLFTLDGPPLDGIADSITFDIRGLDARLRSMRMEVIEPVVVKSLNLHCEYPKYLQDEYSSRPAVETVPFRVGLRIPEGTKIRLEGECSSPLSEVEYVIFKPDRSDTSEIEIKSQTPTENRFDIPLGQLFGNTVVEIRLFDQYGLPTDQIVRYSVNTVVDEVPAVESQLAGIGSAITPDAILPIRGTVQDDYALASTQVELIANDDQPISVPFRVERKGEIKTDIDLRALAEQGKIQLRPDMTLGLVVSASDYYNLTEVQHVGRGQPQQLSVVTPDQLLILLDRQELELRQRLEIIISELQQLDSAIRSLGEQLQSATVKQSASRPSVRPVEHFVQTRPRTQMIGDEGSSAEEDRIQIQRTAMLRAQQAVLQGDKSEQELRGVANRIENLRQQLVNNRIDSYDRQARLNDKIFLPLNQMLDVQYRQLTKSLLALQTATSSGGGTEQCDEVATAVEAVLKSLAEIQTNMLDIESFNEIVDLVRAMLEEQEGLLKQSEEQQKQRVLDLFK